jgi:hypothetical protein
MFFQCHSDGDSSAPSTNGDWPEADDEKEDERMQQSEDVEVDVMKEVKTTIHNGGPVDGEVDVPAEVLVSMQSMPATIDQQCVAIMSQIHLLKTQKKKIIKNTSLIPGFRLSIDGRHFHLLPIGVNTRVWNECRAKAARNNRGKKMEANIRSKPMLKAYLEYLYGKGEM